jgi:hypothetical protein
VAKMWITMCLDQGAGERRRAQWARASTLHGSRSHLTKIGARRAAACMYATQAAGRLSSTIARDLLAR